MHSRLIAATRPRTSGVLAAVRIIGSRKYTDFNLHEDSLIPKDNSISKGHLASIEAQNKHNIQTEFLRDAMIAHQNDDNFSIDAASPNLRPNLKDRSLGNPEGIGMLDQVGSASGTAMFFENGGKQGMHKIR